LKYCFASNPWQDYCFYLDAYQTRGKGTNFKGKAVPAIQYDISKERAMKIGFAVQVNQGLESTVYNHFGSAPAFIIVDTERNTVLTLDNSDKHHVHGACNPVRALDGNKLDAMVVEGIGAGALMKLNALGIKVYETGAPTVKENIALLDENRLPELSQENSCRSHRGQCGR
jgi:predicted Fe-Mo cluster-binding NifX family protein